MNFTETLREPDLFVGRAIHATNPDLNYIPFITRDGRVGYQVRRPDQTIANYIYLNPSDDTDDGEPNVFVYVGPNNDPAQDDAQHWYAVTDLSSDLSPEEAMDPSLDDHGAPDSEGFGYD